LTPSLDDIQKFFIGKAQKIRKSQSGELPSAKEIKSLIPRIKTKSANVTSGKIAGGKNWKF
jgi:hypothetical protein